MRFARRTRMNCQMPIATAASRVKANSQKTRESVFIGLRSPRFQGR